jgi:hypothetical protein
MSSLVPHDHVSSWADLDLMTGVYQLIRLQSPTEDCPDRVPLSAMLAGM